MQYFRSLGLSLWIVVACVGVAQAEPASIEDLTRSMGRSVRAARAFDEKYFKMPKVSSNPHYDSTRNAKVALVALELQAAYWLKILSILDDLAIVLPDEEDPGLFRGVFEWLTVPGSVVDIENILERLQALYAQQQKSRSVLLRASIFFNIIHCPFAETLRRLEYLRNDRTFTDFRARNHFNFDVENPPSLHATRQELTERGAGLLMIRLRIQHFIAAFDAQITQAQNALDNYELTGLRGIDRDSPRRPAIGSGHVRAAAGASGISARL